MRGKGPSVFLLSSAAAPGLLRRIWQLQSHPAIPHSFHTALWGTVSGLPAKGLQAKPKEGLALRSRAQKLHCPSISDSGTEQCPGRERSLGLHPRHQKGKKWTWRENIVQSTVYVRVVECSVKMGTPQVWLPEHGLTLKHRARSK